MFRATSRGASDGPRDLTPGVRTLVCESLNTPGNRCLGKSACRHRPPRSGRQRTVGFHTVGPAGVMSTAKSIALAGS